jgi:RNA-directed DNA polymerase
MIFQVFFNQKKNDQISKLLSYCDYITFKYVWNWACQRHPNKSKKWIKEKYFNYVENKKWIFSAFNLSTKSLLILRKH